VGNWHQLLDPEKCENVRLKHAWAHYLKAQCNVLVKVLTQGGAQGRMLLLF
jgi:hypothetical protein